MLTGTAEAPLAGMVFKSRPTFWQLHSVLTLDSLTTPAVDESTAQPEGPAGSAGSGAPHVTLQLHRRFVSAASEIAGVVVKVGFSHCFRTEAGSRGADVRGLYRLHQFSAPVRYGLRVQIPYNLLSVLECDGH